VIDFEEAKEIFENVELPTATLISIMQARGRDIFAPRTGAQFYSEMVTSRGEPIKADVDEKKPAATIKTTKPARERPNATAIAAEKKGETATERNQRRDTLLRYGHIFTDSMPEEANAPDSPTSKRNDSVPSRRGRRSGNLFESET
jgi:hypothetical protein